MGGKPNPGTKPDKRLKTNKAKKVSTKVAPKMNKAKVPMTNSKA